MRVWVVRLGVLGVSSGFVGFRDKAYGASWVRSLGHVSFEA